MPLAPWYEGFVGYHPQHGWVTHNTPSQERPGVLWKKGDFKRTIVIEDPAWILFEDRRKWNRVNYRPFASELIAYWQKQNEGRATEAQLRMALLAMGFTGPQVPGSGFEPDYQIKLSSSPWVEEELVDVQFHPYVREHWYVLPSYDHYKREGEGEGGGSGVEILNTTETTETPWPENYQWLDDAYRTVQRPPCWAKGNVVDMKAGIARLPWRGVQFRHRGTGLVDVPNWTLPRFLKHGQGRVSISSAVSNRYPMKQYWVDSIGWDETPDEKNWYYGANEVGTDYRRVIPHGKNWGAIWRKADGTVRAPDDEGTVKEAVQDAQFELAWLWAAEREFDFRPIELFAESLRENKEAGALPTRVAVFAEMWQFFLLNRHM